METNSIPLGERALTAIRDHVIALGDAAETTYLEVKSSIDLAAKEGTVKVAKFLLGTANRLPRNAERHFHGYSVLVLGVAKGGAQGIPRGVEAHELEDKLRPYLGADFPGFELGRLEVDSDNEVLFVIGLPPKTGQPMYPCRRSFHGAKDQESITDGAIYVRGASNTRFATSGEIQALIQRGQEIPKPPISLEVCLLGTVSRVARVSEVLEGLYEAEEEGFSTTPTTKQSPYSNIASADPFNVRAMTKRKRTELLQKWKTEQPAHMEKGRAHFLGAGLPGVGFEIISHGRFIAKPHLTITFHDCEAFEFRNSDEADYDRVVEPILGREGKGWLVDYGGITPRDYPVDWDNRGNDVEVVLTPDSFRPDTPWRTDQDDYVVACNDLDAASVRVSWVLTEDGSDVTTRGELEIRPASEIDAGELFASMFRNASR